MKNITLAFAIVLGFCATEAEAQARRDSISCKGKTVVTKKKEQWKAGHRLELSEIKELHRKAQEDCIEIVRGCGGVAKVLDIIKEQENNARIKLDGLLALEEKSKCLSSGALAIYKERCETIKSQLSYLSNSCARIQTVFALEKIAEFEQVKSSGDESDKGDLDERGWRKKADLEYLAFAAASGVDRAYVAEGVEVAAQSELFWENEESQYELRALAEAIKADKLRKAKEKGE